MAELLTNAEQEIVDKIRKLCESSLYNKLYVFAKLIRPFIDEYTIYPLDLSRWQIIRMDIPSISTNTKLQIAIKQVNTQYWDFHDSMQTIVSPHNYDKSMATTYSIRFEFLSQQGYNQLTPHSLTNNEDDNRILRRFISMARRIDCNIADDNSKQYLDSILPPKVMLTAPDVTLELKLKYLDAKYRQLQDLDENFDLIWTHSLAHVAKTMGVNELQHLDVKNQNQLDLALNMFKTPIERKLLQLQEIQCKTFLGLQEFITIVDTDVIQDAFDRDCTNYPLYESDENKCKIELVIDMNEQDDWNEDNDENYEPTFDDMDFTIYINFVDTSIDTNWAYTINFENNPRLPNYDNGDKISVFDFLHTFHVEYAHQLSLPHRLNLAMRFYDRIPTITSTLRNWAKTGMMI